MLDAARSMTGMGQARGPLSARLVATVRMVSVNGRALEVSLRTYPRIETAELELAVRQLLAERLTRGRVQVIVELERGGATRAALEFNWDVARDLQAALASRPDGFEVAPPTLRDLLALPGFAEGMGELRLADDERAALLALVTAARNELDAARAREAAALATQVEREIACLRTFQSWLADTNSHLRELLFARIRQRLAVLLDGVEVAPERLLQEAALATDRSDVSEEVQRLAAHLDHLDRLLGTGGVIGKKIDFLLQELLREVNTAGSKCREAGMGEQVVEAKAALERLREQAANLE